MSIGKCKDCDALVNMLVRGLCPRCLDVRNEAFQKVRHYFRTTRNATATMCSEETDIPMDWIGAWIAEGRLTVAHGLSSADIQSHMREEERVADIRKAFAEQAGAQAAQVADEFQRRRQGMHGRDY